MLEVSRVVTFAGVSSWEAGGRLLGAGNTTILLCGRCLSWVSSLYRTHRFSIYSLYALLYTLEISFLKNKQAPLEDKAQRLLSYFILLLAYHKLTTVLFTFWNKIVALFQKLLGHSKGHLNEIKIIRYLNPSLYQKN